MPVKTRSQIEENLIAGDCVMYRDFVAAYNCEGRKIQNFVFVVLYRTVPNGPLLTYKFNNICDNKETQSADPAYFADVFCDFFKRNLCDFFKRHNITRVYLSGDHGFSSIQTLYNESLFKEKYGIEFKEKYGIETVLFFLCSYHNPSEN